MAAEESDYSIRLANVVKQALASGAPTLTDVCRAAQGAFPTDVRDAVRRLHGEDLPIRAFGASGGDWEDAAPPGAAEPHPLDFEWRYTVETANALADRLASDGPVACFGTPSVFWRLIDRGVEAFLFDRNPAALAILQNSGPSLPKGGHDKIRVIDIPMDLDRTDLPDFGAAIVDPPWYLDRTLAWSGIAASVVQPVGRLIVTLFPELVRPQAWSERTEVFRALRQLGRVQSLDFRADYATPRFESETLAAAGLGGLGRWRSGELVEVSLSADREDLPPVTLDADDHWARVRIGDQVIAVRGHQPGPVTLRPAQPDASFQLASVSARDPVRRLINLWTSRNRAGIVTGTVEVLAFLRLLSTGVSLERALSDAAPSSRAGLERVARLIGF